MQLFQKKTQCYAKQWYTGDPTSIQGFFAIQNYYLMINNLCQADLLPVEQLSLVKTHLNPFQSHPWSALFTLFASEYSLEHAQVNCDVSGVGPPLTCVRGKCSRVGTSSKCL